MIILWIIIIVLIINMLSNYMHIVNLEERVESLENIMYWKSKGRTQDDR